MQGIFSLRPDLALQIATTGTEGLEMARLRAPDLVMLDLHLPGLSGEDVLDQMKADPGLKNVPVIIVSADATPAQVEALVLRGAAAFITKPVDIGTLFEALQENLPAS
jgi:CheY-like chemotaxis protein